MKCCNCGSFNVVKVDREYESWGDGGSGYVTEVEEFICLDCGKIMTFSPKLVEIIKSRMSSYNEEINRLTVEIEEIKKQIDVLTNDDEFKKICNRKDFLEAQKNNIDITIRQKQEYEAELSALRQEYTKGWYRCVKPLENLNRTLKKKEDRVSELKRYMEQGSWGEKYKK